MFANIIYYTAYYIDNIDTSLGMQQNNNNKSNNMHYTKYYFLYTRVQLLVISIYFSDVFTRLLILMIISV
jgi:hypothetical protein